MTGQEIFDKIVTHLRQQGQKSLGRLGCVLGCVYRNPEGLKCAAGCLIPDDRYDPLFEGFQWFEISENFPEYRNHLRLIVDMQYVHDSRDIADWEERFAAVARVHSLTYTAPAP